MSTTSTIIISLLAAMTLTAADTPKPQHGAKGGCYVIVTRKKDGKQYKRYVDQVKCKGGTK